MNEQSKKTGLISQILTAGANHMIAMLIIKELWKRNGNSKRSPVSLISVTIIMMIIVPRHASNNTPRMPKISLVQVVATTRKENVLSATVYA
jgi:hypothetical protein